MRYDPITALDQTHPYTGCMLMSYPATAHYMEGDGHTHPYTGRMFIPSPAGAVAQYMEGDDHTHPYTGRMFIPSPASAAARCGREFVQRTCTRRSRCCGKRAGRPELPNY